MEDDFSSVEVDMCFAFPAMSRWNNNETQKVNIRAADIGFDFSLSTERNRIVTLFCGDFKE